MKTGMRIAGGVVLLAVLAWPLGAAEAPVTDDEKVLAGVGLKTDGASLLRFFRKRSLTTADQEQIAGLIRNLGSNEFRDREEASQALLDWRTPALEQLRKALKDPDAEVVRRAGECIEQIEKGPGPQLPMAAARLLVQRRPPGAVPVLLGYLPFADEDAVVEEICNCLLALSPEKSPLERSLLDALQDPRPVRRGAAAHVVARRGDAGQRQRVLPLLADKDAGVRFRAARGLLAARERQAVPALVNLLAEAPLDLACQAEDVLFLLAGDKAPLVSLSVANADARRKCHADWLAWWKEHGGTLDLTRYQEGQRLLGLTLGIEYNTGRVWEARLDRGIRWEIAGLKGPMEAQVLPNGRILIAESEAHAITERDTRGTILWEKKITEEPTGVQRLANGNTFVSSYGKAMEFDRNGNLVYSFAVGNGSNAIHKHRNGNVIFATDVEIVEMDTAGKKVRSVPLPKDGMWVGLRDLPQDRFVVANSTSGRVLEVDRKGQILWQGQVAGACGVARLPSGNTLVATSGRVVELNRASKVVWEIKSQGYVRRVHRR